MLDVLWEGLFMSQASATLFIGLFTTFMLYWYSTRNYAYFRKKGIPYCKPAPFIGSIFKSVTRFLHETEVERYKELGPIYGHFQGSRPMLSVADPTLLRDILVRDFQYFTSCRDVQTSDKIVDATLSFANGERWKRIRAIVTPTFTIIKIKRMMGIFKDCSQTLVQNFREASMKGNDVDCKRYFGAFAMDVIASTAFSTKIDSHNDPDNPFVVAAQSLFSHNVNWRNLLFLVAPKVMKFFHIGYFTPEFTDFFINATHQIIEKRKQTGQTRNDFLQLLLDTAQEASNDPKGDDINKESDLLRNFGDEPNTDHHIFQGVDGGKKRNLSMDELVAQCVNFFAAGYNTTASTLSFCSHQLAMNPDIQKKLREEVDTAIKAHGGDLSYEALQDMKYLDNIISETLRMHPPIVKIKRVAEADYKLGDTGIMIPKDMMITIPIYAIQRDPKHFPDPEKFDPDRFSPEEKAKRDPYAYLPFAAGPRNCVGMRFALMEIKICMAYIIANFRITKSPKTKLPFDYYMGQGLLQPKELYIRTVIRDDCPLVN